MAEKRLDQQLGDLSPTKTLSTCREKVGTQTTTNTGKK